MTDLTKVAQLYLQGGGVRCLYCGSESLTGTDIRTDIGIAWQNISCDDCGEEWNDVYTLTGITVEERTTVDYTLDPKD